MNDKKMLFIDNDDVVHFLCSRTHSGRHFPPGCFCCRANVERAVFDQINQDRAEAGLSTAEWDEVAAVAAREHAAEMARKNYMSHWDVSGKKPRQRYTEAGGTYGTSENVGYFRVNAHELDQDLVQRAVLLLLFTETGSRDVIQ